MEDFKSFQVELDTIDKSGKKLRKPFTINVSSPIIKEQKLMASSIIDYSMTFKMAIPDYIHEAILDKDIPLKTGLSQYGISYRDLKKTITSNTLEGVTNKWNEIVRSYSWVISMDKRTLIKTIFYKFGSRSDKSRSYWDSTPFGDVREIKYDFVIGYVESPDSDAAEIRYNIDKKQINKHQDKEFYSLDSVEWSEEREAFFIQMSASMDALVNKIKMFDEKIKLPGVDLKMLE